MSYSSHGRTRWRKVRYCNRDGQMHPAQSHSVTLIVSILSSLLTPTVHPHFAIRFVSHDSLLQAQNGGGGAIPYSPEVVVDVIANLVGRLDPGEPLLLDLQYVYILGSHKAFIAQELQYSVLRDVLLASSPIAEHETLNHPVSCKCLGRYVFTICKSLTRSFYSPLGGVDPIRRPR
jgi:hypothetical protein